MARRAVRADNGRIDAFPYFTFQELSIIYDTTGNYNNPLHNPSPPFREKSKAPPPKGRVVPARNLIILFPLTHLHRCDTHENSPPPNKNGAYPFRICPTNNISATLPTLALSRSGSKGIFSAFAAPLTRYLIMLCVRLYSKCFQQIKTFYFFAGHRLIQGPLFLLTGFGLKMVF